MVNQLPKLNLCSMPDFLPDDLVEILFAIKDPRNKTSFKEHKEHGTGPYYNKDVIWYYKNKVLHRDNGPAVITPNHRGFFIEGIETNSSNPIFNQAKLDYPENFI